MQYYITHARTHARARTHTHTRTARARTHTRTTRARTRTLRYKGRCHGGMLRTLATGTESPSFKTACAQDFSKTVSVHPAGNGYPTLLWAEKGEGGDYEEWHMRYFLFIHELSLISTNLYNSCSVMVPTSVNLSLKRRLRGFCTVKRCGEPMVELVNWSVVGHITREVKSVTYRLVWYLRRLDSLLSQ